MPASYERAPGDVRIDYDVDWSKWLAPKGDAISTSTWDVIGPDAALVLSDEDVVDGKAIVWVEGGALGAAGEAQTYYVVNHIVTGANRRNKRTLTFLIREL